MNNIHFPWYPAGCESAHVNVCVEHKMVDINLLRCESGFLSVESKWSELIAQ